MEGRMEGWKERWKEGWKDGRKDGRVKGWKDGRMENCIVPPLGRPPPPEGAAAPRTPRVHSPHHPRTVTET
jgi:hypothetical protein